MFLLITFWKYNYIIFKDKKSKRCNKAVGIKIFLTIFAWWYKNPDPDPDPDLWLMEADPDPRGPKHVDPDPQHWQHLLKILRYIITVCAPLTNMMRYCLCYLQHIVQYCHSIYIWTVLFLFCVLYKSVHMLFYREYLTACLKLTLKGKLIG